MTIKRTYNFSVFLSSDISAFWGWANSVCLLDYTFCIQFGYIDQHFEEEFGHGKNSVKIAIDSLVWIYLNSNSSNINVNQHLLRDY